MRPITFDDLTEHARIGALDRLRAAEPVSWVPALGGWLVTSWELARSVLGRRDEFSVWAEPNLVRASLGVMMLTSQGDAHTRQRAPFDAPFRMRAVRDTFAEPIAARTDALLAALRPAGECELGAAFAGPFAVGWPPTCSASGLPTSAGSWPSTRRSPARWSTTATPSRSAWPTRREPS